MATRAGLRSLPARVVPLFAAAAARKRDEKPHDAAPQPAAWKEVDPYWNLSVKVLHAKNIAKSDILSQSDCYVTLRLPTASAKTHRTKTVNDSSSPVWNETFHYRIHSRVKNILELNIYDEDTVSCDDRVSKVLFDIDNLSPGKTERKVFLLDPQTRDELWVEFAMEESNDPPGQYITNGVLVAGPFARLEVKVKEKETKHEDKNLVLKLTGAYEEEQVVPGKGPDGASAEPLTFYINGDLETELKVKLRSVKHEGKKMESINKEEETEVAEEEEQVEGEVIPSALKFLPAGQEVVLSVPVGQEDVDLQLKTTDCSKELDVRLSFDIPEEEKEFVERRRRLVTPALQRALQLSQAPKPQEVPVVAVVGSGGGTRAMTALHGSLKALQALGLLDTVMYMAGVSGSTWAMSNLYSDADWSQRDLQGPITRVQAETCKNQHGAFSPGQLQYYYQEVQNRRRMGQLVSVIDMWGLIIEYYIHGQMNPRMLSDQQEAIVGGQNPYPIYTAVNMKDGILGSSDTAEWCEFTPHEVGFPKYGAFIHTRDFGSEFYMGHLIRKKPETRLSFLLGIWSSIFSVNLAKAWSTLTGSVPSYLESLGEDVRNNDEKEPFEPSALDTYFITPVSDLGKMLKDFLTDRPIIGQSYNFLRGFSLHWDYSENSGFTAWKETHPDAFPNDLTPSDTCLHLVDSGFAINTGFPPLVRPHRGVNVILSFNFTWGDQFKDLKLTAQYCRDHKLPFPHIDFSSLEGRPLQECYVFKDDDPRVPIVLHFPLTNTSFREYHAPGVKHVGGEVDVSSHGSPYRTYKMSYSPAEFAQLVDLAAYNVANNREAIIEALREALDRKRAARGGAQP
ncbi:cytosolic phospholipase A2 zeta isoform X2 [Amia ocellicauda]|uniref:cytosolic phospholipase A2 zeta isoform X2 n=1 Tax=Amia ocellicauda TaxID=2972642 RepID=UPI003463F257